EVLFIAFNVIYIIPRFRKLLHDGYLDPAMIDDANASWMPAFLTRLSDVTGSYTTFMLLGAIVAWGLFEWFVRSENKSFIRLSALGMATVGLMVVVCLTAGSLVVAFCLGIPAMGRIAQPFAMEQVSHIEASVGALEQAQLKKDWQTMQEQA